MSEIKIACLGPDTTHTAVAAEGFRRLLPEEATVVTDFTTEAEVCEAVKLGKAHFGVVAIESKHEGAVLRSLRAFRENGLNIFAELETPIRHYLWGLQEASLDDVEVVYSRDQAYTQCSNWLAGKTWQREFSSSTAAACAQIAAKGDRHVAAIAGEKSGEKYDLKNLAGETISNDGAATRFWAVRGSYPPFAPPKQPNGLYRTSFYLQLANVKGSLVAVLHELQEYNLLWIQSYFLRGGEPPHWDYHFFLTYEGGAGDPVYTIEKELASTQSKVGSELARTFDHLGTYPYFYLAYE